MSNYIIKSKLYNTGFIQFDNNLRKKQGLQPQVISNSCFNQNNYSNDLKNNNTCYSSMYPAFQPQLDYGLKDIKYNCSCALLK